MDEWKVETIAPIAGISKLSRRIFKPCWLRSGSYRPLEDVARWRGVSRGVCPQKMSFNIVSQTTVDAAQRSVLVAIEGGLQMCLISGILPVVGHHPNTQRALDKQTVRSFSPHLAKSTLATH